MDIISTKHIPNLIALRDELKQLEFEVSPATVSRDINELNLLKSKEGYLLPKSLNGAPKQFNPDPTSVLRRSVVKIDTAQHMVVIRTRPGSAQQVGLSLDDRVFDNIVGTVAGDDTVLVVSLSTQKAMDVRDSIMDAIG